MKVKLYLSITAIFIIFFITIYKIFYEIKKEEKVKEIIKVEKIEKIKKVEDSIIVSMHNKISSCRNDYFLGFYKIYKDDKAFETIDIIRSFKNDTYSILPYNPYFVKRKKFDELTILALKYINNKTIFFPNPQDFAVVEDFLNNSLSSIKHVGLVLIKDKQNKPVYGFSLSVLNYSSCTKKDVIKILKDLANELGSQL